MTNTELQQLEDLRQLADGVQREINRERANLEFMRPYFERLGPGATVRDVLGLIAKEKAARHPDEPEE